MTQQFTAQGFYSDSSVLDLTSNVDWTSSDTSVATIDAGQALAREPGVSIIQASFAGVAGERVMLVTTPVLQSIALEAVDTSIAKGKSQPFIVTGTYSDGSTEDITLQTQLTSTVESVATIGRSGSVNALTEGTTSITASWGDLQDSLDVVVTAPTLQSLAVTPGAPRVAKGLTLQLKASGLYSDGSIKDHSNEVVWIAVGDSVSISNSGIAMTQAEGTSEILATLGDTVGSTNLIVTPAIVQAIEILPTDPYLVANIRYHETRQLFVRGSFSDATTRDLTPLVDWSSADPSVVTVSESGLVTTVDEGTTSIVAQFNGVSASTDLIATSVHLDYHLTGVDTPGNAGLVAVGESRQIRISSLQSDPDKDFADQGTFIFVRSRGCNRDRVRLVTVLGGNADIQFSLAPGVALHLDVQDLVALKVEPVNPISRGSFDFVVPPGFTQQFVATGTFANQATRDLTDQVTWSSADSASEIMISSSGGATPLVAGGFYGITAQIGELGFESSFAVLELVEIEIIGDDPVVTPGIARPLRAEGVFANGPTNERLDMTGAAVWTSSNPDVASVSAGLVDANRRQRVHNDHRVAR